MHKIVSLSLSLSSQEDSQYNILKLLLLINIAYIGSWNHFAFVFVCVCVSLSLYLSCVSGPDDKPSENIFFVWSKTSYDGDKWRRHHGDKQPNGKWKYSANRHLKLSFAIKTFNKHVFLIAFVFLLVSYMTWPDLFVTLIKCLKCLRSLCSVVKFLIKIALTSSNVGNSLWCSMILAILDPFLSQSFYTSLISLCYRILRSFTQKYILQTVLRIVDGVTTNSPLRVLCL